MQHSASLKDPPNMLLPELADAPAPSQRSRADFVTDVIIR